MTYSRISGTGRYLPEKLVTNADLEKIVDTTDEWIRTRTGIEQRHLASEDESTSDLCVNAARKAMDSAGVSEKDIDIFKNAILNGKNKTFEIGQAESIFEDLGIEITRNL